MKGLVKNDKTKVWRIETLTFGKRSGKSGKEVGLSFMRDLPPESTARKIPGVAWDAGGIC
jgi:hypothetical protein